MKKFVCVVIALLLVAASVAVLYSGLMYKLFPDEALVVYEKVDGILEDEAAATGAGESLATQSEAASDGESKLNKLGLDYFPLYTSVYNLAADYADDINEGKVEGLKGAGSDAVALSRSEDFMQSLYNLIIIALLSIPVYRILRWLCFNTLYKTSGQDFLLSRPFTRGLTCVAATVSSITVTWFLYHSILYRLAIAKFETWIKSVDTSKITFNLANIVIIVVLAAAIIAIVKRTVFGGSFLKSILLGLLRGVLFVVTFALTNALIDYQGFTWKALVFALAALAVVGIVDLFIEPPVKKESKQRA